MRRCLRKFLRAWRPGGYKAGKQKRADSSPVKRASLVFCEEFKGVNIADSLAGKSGGLKAKKQKPTAKGKEVEGLWGRFKATRKPFFWLSNDWNGPFLKFN
jgi:hypothetical protein